MTERYTYVWEFQVLSGCEAEFERHYGPDGTWARLFAQATGYVETVLLKDSASTGRYLTIDRWVNAEAYRAFRSAYSLQYEQLDQQCAKLTANEHLIGLFEELAE